MNSVLVAVLVFACIFMMTTAQSTNATVAVANITSVAPATLPPGNTSATTVKGPGGAACNIQTPVLLLLIAAIFSRVF